MNFNISKEQIQGYVDMAIEMGMAYAPKVVLALLTLFIGLFLIGRLNRLILRFFEKQDFDPAVESFLASLISIGLKVLLLFSVVSMLGVQTTSFLAVLGAAGLAVGLALQGSLSNFAGGVLILIFKPFKIGDYIEAQGHAGTVSEIQIFNTVLHTPDNKKIIIPNGNLSNNSMVNYTAEKKRRCDFVLGIGYNDDIKKAKQLLEKILSKDPRTIKKEPLQIIVGNLGESSVDVFARAWVKTDDYWDFFFENTEAIKIACDKAGISIPFPQRDVHHYYEQLLPENKK